MERFLSSPRFESGALVFLLSVLGLNAGITAFAGFSLIAFALTVPLCAVVAFLAPRAGLTAAVITTVIFERFFTLEPLAVAGHTLKAYPLDFILVAVFLALGVRYLKEGKKLFTWRNEDALLAFFFIWVTVLFGAAVFLPGDAEAAVAFSSWKNYVFYALISLATLGLLRTQQDVLTFAKLFLTGVAAAGVFFLIGLINGGGLWTEYTPLSTEGVRLLAFPHTFYFSLALLTGLLSLPLWFKKASRSVQVGFSAWVAVLIGGIVGSLMRHLWLGIILALGTAFLSAPIFYGKAALSFAVRAAVPAVLTAVVLVALLSIPQTSGGVQGNFTHVGERVTSFGNAEDSSFAWRLVVWKESLKKFAQSPVLGVGFGESVAIQMDEYHSVVEIRNMHNSWLAIIIQTGIVGGVFLLGYIFIIVKSLFVEARKHTTLGQMDFVILGLLVFQGFVFLFQPYLETNFFNMFFWVTLGIGRVLVAQKSSRIPS